MKNVFLILVLLVVSACSPQFQVFTDQDPEADIRLFSKFKWLDITNIEAGQNPLYYNELNDKRIKTAVNEQLKLNGYMLDKANAEFIVHYHIVVKEKGTVYTDNLGYSYSKYWRDEKLHLYQYSEGTIIVDIMDARSNDLIWRGWAVSVIDYEKTGALERTIKTSIEKIFVEFPYSFSLKPGNQNL